MSSRLTGTMGSPDFQEVAEEFRAADPQVKKRFSVFFTTDRNDLGRLRWEEGKKKLVVNIVPRKLVERVRSTLWLVAIVGVTVTVFCLLPSYSGLRPFTATFSEKGIMIEVLSEDQEVSPNLVLPTPHPPSDPSPQPTPTLRPRVELVKDAYLYEWPCEECPIIRTYLPGDQCELIESLPHNGWFHVRCGLELKEGWIWGERLTIVES